MLIYNGQVIAGGGTIVLPMTRAEYEANKAVLDTADVWVDLTDEPDQVATADQIAYSVDNVQKSMGYIGDIAIKAVAKVEPTDTALYLHEVGEYFINKDGDACKVDIQIPVNGTITLGTNCHVLPKGVTNDINSKLSALTGGDTETMSDIIDTSTIASGVSIDKAVCRAGIVCIQGATQAGVGGSTLNVAKVKSSYLPSTGGSSGIGATISSSTPSDFGKAEVSLAKATGQIAIYATQNTSYGVNFNLVYAK